MRPKWWTGSASLWASRGPGGEARVAGADTFGYRLDHRVHLRLESAGAGEALVAATVGKVG